MATTGARPRVAHRNFTGKKVVKANASLCMSPCRPFSLYLCQNPTNPRSYSALSVYPAPYPGFLGIPGCARISCFNREAGTQC